MSLPAGQRIRNSPTVSNVPAGRRPLVLSLLGDRNGNLVDVQLSETRDRAAAEAFFGSAQTVAGITPQRVTTDGYDAYPGTIKAEPGKGVTHRDLAPVSPDIQAVAV
jgi:transposase-like protein